MVPYPMPWHAFPSLLLDAKDSHVNVLRTWDGDPGNDPNMGFETTVNWWLDGVPAMQYPNIFGKTVTEAFDDLRKCGVAENFLQDTLTNATNPYTNGEGTDNGWLPTSGILIWRYLAPNHQIGTHWDGSPWYASEAENRVTYAYENPGQNTAVGSYYESGGDFYNSSDPTQEGLRYPYWSSFCAIQTTDPTKNSWDWWN